MGAVDPMAAKPARTALHPAFDRGDQFGKRKLVMVQTAISAFNRRGFHATSLDEIAAELGLNKATLYHYFKNKADLLYECMLHAVNDGRLIAEQAEAGGGSGAEKLERFLRLQFQTLAGRNGSSWLIADISALPEARRNEIRRLSRVVDTKVQKFIADGVADGSMAATEPKIAEFFLIGALNWLPRWYSPDGRISSDELATIFIRIVMDGLRVKPL
jgi:TetR/AcrR family transcriptional regulator